MIGIVLTAILLPVLGVAGYVVHAMTPPTPVPPSEEEIMEAKLAPHLEALFKQAFEIGYVYALRGEIRPPTAEEREAWAYSLPAELSCAACRGDEIGNLPYHFMGAALQEAA